MNNARRGGRHMGNLWLKVKIWTKIVIFAFLAFYILVFVIKNGDRQSQFWYWFGRDYNVPLLFLVFFAFLSGALVTILLSTTVRTLRQIRDLRARSRGDRLEREVADMKAKAAMLQTKPAAPGHSEPAPASLRDVAPPVDREDQ